jgi:hypothetical protein
MDPNNNKKYKYLYLFYVLHQQLKGQLQTQHNKYNMQNVNQEYIKEFSTTTTTINTTNTIITTTNINTSTNNN